MKIRAVLGLCFAAACGTLARAEDAPAPTPAGPPPVIEICTRLDDSDLPADPGTVFSPAANKIIAMVSSTTPADLAFSARLVVVTAPPYTSGLVLAHKDDLFLGAEMTDRRTRAEMDLPRVGLVPGEYRIELFHPGDPPVAITQATFSSREVAAPVDFDLAESDNGGLVESGTGEDGAGLSWIGALLQARQSHPWSPPASAPPPEGAPELPPFAPYEMVFSFYQRESATAVAVVIDLPDGGTSACTIELFAGTADRADQGFASLAKQEFAAELPALRLDFAPTALRFLKLRLTPGPGATQVPQFLRVHVLEGTAPGYQALAVRRPDVKAWRIQPRHAAQQGLFFLQPSATDWQREHACLGCHVQTQALFGLGEARRNGYIYSQAVERLLAGLPAPSQNDGGDFARTPARDEHEEVTNTVHTAHGLLHTNATDATALGKAARWLANKQAEDGSLPPDEGRYPVTQGEIMHTAMALDIWAEAAKRNPAELYTEARRKALDYVAQTETHTTQDEVFQILTLAHHGGTALHATVEERARTLASQQMPDGSWVLTPGDAGSTNPFATGEALHALREAGMSPATAVFRRGVRLLVDTQLPDGSWRDPSGNISSPFTATMWPVIALSGAFGLQAEPARLIVTARPRPAPPKPPRAAVQKVVPVAALPKNILFVLDCSLSMEDRLGKTTRFKTAQQVLRDLVARLPGDATVGLRLYGHRYGPNASLSQHDTELVVPLKPLDRTALLAAIDRAAPHGQTPLVYSVMQAATDLKPPGGGAIILVTDGEESCGGKPRQAGPQLAAMGFPLRLDIVGFTLSGKRVTADMIQFTAPTHGRFYTAADGPQLAQALTAAITPPAADEPAPVIVDEPVADPEPEKFPFEVIDAQGKVVAEGRTGGVVGQELSPGRYKVALHDGTKLVTTDLLDLGESAIAELLYDPADGKLSVSVSHP